MLHLDVCHLTTGNSTNVTQCVFHPYPLSFYPFMSRSGGQSKCFLRATRVTERSSIWWWIVHESSCRAVSPVILQETLLAKPVPIEFDGSEEERQVSGHIFLNILMYLIVKVLCLLYCFKCFNYSLYFWRNELFVILLEKLPAVNVLF